MLKFIYFAIVLSLAIVGEATAANISLSCTAPTTRTDGSPLAANEIGGYEFTFNGASFATPNLCAYLYNIEAGSCVKTTDAFAVRVKDTAGVWSAYSAPVSVGANACTPKSPPVAPALKITVAP
jgi:hypothetical protein